MHLLLDQLTLSETAVKGRVLAAQPREGNMAELRADRISIDLFRLESLDRSMAATLPFLLAAFGFVALCQAGSLKFNITRRHTSIVLSRRSTTDATILEMVASISP